MHATLPAPFAGSGPQPRSRCALARRSAEPLPGEHPPLIPVAPALVRLTQNAPALLPAIVCASRRTTTRIFLVLYRTPLRIVRCDPAPLYARATGPFSRMFSLSHCLLHDTT